MKKSSICEHKQNRIKYNLIKMWRRGCDLSANERAREPSDKERHDTIRHKSIHVLLTAYYIAVKCVWGKKTHNDGIIAAVSCGWHEHLGTKKKPKKNAYRKCVFFSASCVMLCGVNRGNILPLQATQRWVPNAPTYDYLIYQIQMIFTFYILHFFYLPSAGTKRESDRGILSQLTTVQCCRQHDKLCGHSIGRLNTY